MKSFVSLTPPDINMIKNAGFSRNANDTRLVLENGYFDVIIPFNTTFGFAEDYKKIIINAMYELILTRARNDINAIIQQGEGADKELKISIIKLEWMLPYILPSDNNKIKLLKFIEKDPLISISF